MIGFTANEMYEFFSDLYHIPKAKRSQRKEELFDKFGIASFSDVKSCHNNLKAISPHTLCQHLCYYKITMLRRSENLKCRACCLVIYTENTKNKQPKALLYLTNSLFTRFILDFIYSHSIVAGGFVVIS
jgi:hypothetical protein